MRLMIAAALAVMAAGAAWGDTKIIFECGASSGWALYPESGPLSEKNGGWQQDAISGGRIQLVLNGDSLDLIHLDAIGLSSAKAYNAEIALIDATEDVFTVVVNYKSGAKEFYSYLPKQKKLYWSQHKFGVVIDKVAAFESDCAQPSP